MASAAVRNRAAQPLKRLQAAAVCQARVTNGYAMNEIDFIELLLKEASAYVKAKYAGRTRLHVQEKNGANDLLTEVDLAVQNQMVERISSAYPSDVIVAEEQGLDARPANAPKRCWIIDPIDGTQNFLRGLFPAFGITVAFAADGALRAGGVSMPITQDLFLAERNNGAARNGQQVRVSALSDMSRARAEVDFSHPKHRDQTLNVMADVIRRTGQIRCYSSAVVALCSIACGDSEAFTHVGLKPWDYAAGQLIVEEAGGRTSRLDGSPLGLFDGKRGVLATNGAVHDAFLTALGNHSPGGTASPNGSPEASAESESSGVSET